MEPVAAATLSQHTLRCCQNQSTSDLLANDGMPSGAAGASIAHDLRGLSRGNRFIEGSHHVSGETLVKRRHLSILIEQLPILRKELANLFGERPSHHAVKSTNQALMCFVQVLPT